MLNTSVESIVFMMYHSYEIEKHAASRTALVDPKALINLSQFYKTAQ